MSSSDERHENSGAATKDVVSEDDALIFYSTLEQLLFGYFFLAAEKKVTGLKGSDSKTPWTRVPARA